MGGIIAAVAMAAILFTVALGSALVNEDEPHVQISMAIIASQTWLSCFVLLGAYWIARAR